MQGPYMQFTQLIQWLVRVYGHQVVLDMEKKNHLVAIRWFPSWKKTKETKKPTLSTKNEKRKKRKPP